MTFARARSVFDSERLSRALLDNPLEADFGEYLEFYGLPASCEHSADVLNVPVAGQHEQIVLQRFAPANPGSWALFHHGYYDHVGLFAHLYNYLLQHNVGIYAFDQLGHGLSSGPRAMVDTFDDYVQVIESVYEYLVGAGRGDLHFLGQSMGGALILEYLQRHPEVATKEVVLLAPLVRPYAWWINRVYFGLAKRLITARRRTITSNASNPEFLHLQHNDPLQAMVLPVAWVQAMVDWFTVFEQYPVSARAPKIIQGHEDRTISWRHSVGILGRRYPDASWLQIPEASHHLANESEAIRNKIFSWLDDQCAWAEQV